MPHFDNNGNEMVVCQACGQMVDGRSVVWMTVPKTSRQGNVCGPCRTPKLMSLREHCEIESGGLTGAALDRYINRYYGHN